MINTIFQFGEDAFNNEANISIDISKLPEALSSLIGQDTLKFRATSFSIPERNLLTYDQSYKGFTIQRWKPGTDMTRTTDVTFRIDKYWNVYRFFQAWQKLISDISGDGATYPDVSDNSILRTEMTIQQTALALNQETGGQEEKILNTGFIYTGVWPKTVGNVEFDTTSEGDVQTVSVTFSFLNFKEGADQ